MERPFGKYTLLERIGGGGMAEVFRARWRGPEGFEKTLALKLILPHVSEEPEFVRMFIQEATLAAGLDHANIVRIHEFDQVEGRYYIAMELVDGHDLRKLLARSVARDRPLRVAEALAVALEISRGLAFAHGELAPGRPVVVHRDISPHNIIVSRSGEVKISDFGIAKLATAASMTRTGIIKGKTAYMSPEQARGAPVDGRSDLFSLGCVLWEMLAGQRLFTGDNDVAVLENLKRCRVRPPSGFNPEVTPELDRLLGRLLARDPADRVSSAAGLNRELDRLLYDLAGIERNSLLLDLVEDLFPAPRPGTSILAAGSDVPAGSPDAPPEQPVSDEPPTLASIESDAPEETPGKGEETKGQEIEPVGPYAPTRISDRRTRQQRAGHPRRRWWLAAGALLVTVVAVTLLLVWPDSAVPDGPDSPEGAAQVDEVVPATEVTPSPPATVKSAAGSQAGQGTASSPEQGDPEEGTDGEQPSREVRDTTEQVLPRPATHQNNDAKVAAHVSPPGGKDRSGDERAASVRTQPTGKLSLNVIPWARVFWRKTLLGETPIELAEMPAGRHLLVLVNQELGVRRAIRVRIRPGHHTKRVEKLEPSRK